jgi:LAO/AO transport system kinase
MVDFFLLITLAGAGDELQGIKRGVMELADLVAVNKADGENVRAAERARAEAENALHFFPAAETGWTPRAIACSALTGAGIRELWQCVLEYGSLTRSNGWFGRVRRAQQKRWMHETIEQALEQRFAAHPAVRHSMEALERDVAEGRTTSFRAARMLLEMYSRNLGG